MVVFLMLLLLAGICNGQGYKYSMYAGFRFPDVFWTLPEDTVNLPSGRSVSNTLLAVGPPSNEFGPPLLSNPISPVLSSMMETFGLMFTFDVMKLEKMSPEANPMGEDPYPFEISPPSSWQMRIPNCDSTLNPHCIKNTMLPLKRTFYKANSTDKSRVGPAKTPINGKMSIPSATFIYGCGAFGVNCDATAKELELKLRVGNGSCELKSRSAGRALFVF